jgi:hypothetical protein
VDISCRRVGLFPTKVDPWNKDVSLHGMSEPNGGIVEYAAFTVRPTSLIAS